jgi:hypothetical protein
MLTDVNSLLARTPVSALAGGNITKVQKVLSVPLPGLTGWLAAKPG